MQRVVSFGRELRRLRLPRESGWPGPQAGGVLPARQHSVPNWIVGYPWRMAFDVSGQGWSLGGQLSAAPRLAPWGITRDADRMCIEMVSSIRPSLGISST